MANNYWCDYGVRQIAESKKTWAEEVFIKDLFGNLIKYKIELGATPGGDFTRMLVIFFNNQRLVERRVNKSDIDSDEKLTHQIDDIFKSPYYIDLMGNPKIPRYISKEPIEEPKPINEQQDIAEHLNLFLDELDDIAKENASEPVPLSESALVRKYTKELTEYLAG